MESKVLNGTIYRDVIYAGIKKELSEIKQQHYQTPGIGFVAFTGHMPLMKHTIQLHLQAAKELGFKAIIETLPHTSTNDEMVEIIETMNRVESIHAIMLLQPVPEHINAITLVEKIDKNKEVEGFHPLNIIDTLTKGYTQTKYPMCLPTAVIELFDYYGLEIQKNKEFVFVADEDFLSNPFRKLILLTASTQIVPSNCSFTFVNSENKLAKQICKKADYLFVISEKPEFLTNEYIKSGVVIVDVYSNLVRETSNKANADVLATVIRGGVKTDNVKELVGKIAPCPNGLMPVLIGVFFRNILLSYKDKLKLKMH